MKKILLFLSVFSFNIFASNSLKVKSGYHYYLSNSSNKDILNKSSETKHNLSLVLDFSGNIEETIDFDLKLAALDSQKDKTCLTSGAYIAKAKMVVNDLFDLTAGCMHVNTGGWENQNLNTMSHYDENIANRMVLAPLEKYNLGLEVGVNLFGRLSLQFFQDPTKFDYRSKEGYMTLAISWNGNFAGFEPIAQFAMYDEQKSQIYGVGLKTKLMGLSLRADFQQDKRKYKYGVQKDKEDTATTTIYSAFVSYSMLDILIPYIRYQNISKDKNSGVKNDKNGPWGAIVEGNPTMPNNNGQVLSLGLDMKYNDMFVPYFSANMHRGKFAKVSAPAESEDLSNWTFRFGFTGMF